MFDKKLLLQHITNTPESTLQEQGSPIMASERNKFALVPRAATMIAAQSPEAQELQRRADLERRGRVAARRGEEVGASSPYATERWNQITGQYEKIVNTHHDLHLPRLTEQVGLASLKSAAKKAIQSINKIDRSEYPEGEKGDRLYNTEKQMHINGAKRDIHPKHHDKLEDMIENGINEQVSFLDRVRTSPVMSLITGESPDELAQKRRIAADPNIGINISRSNALTKFLRNNKDAVRGKSPDEVEEIFKKSVARAARPKSVKLKKG